MTYRGFEIYIFKGLFYARELTTTNGEKFKSFKSLDGIHLAIDAVLAKRREEDRAENERNYRR